MQTTSTQTYLRVKRRDKTYCLLCEQSDTVASIKEKVGEIILQFGEDEKLPVMRFLQEQSQAVLDDDETLESAKVVDNSVLHLVYCIDEDDELFEPVEVVETAPRGTGESN